MMTTSLRNTLSIAAAVVLLALLASPSHAVLTAAYDFGTSGELNGQGGGTGWSGNWSSDTSLTQLVGAPSNFAYHVPGGGTANATGAIQFTGDSLSAISRSLSGSQNSDVWISFLTQWTGAPGTIDSNDFAVWWFNSQANPNIGLKTNQTASQLDLMARNAAGSEAYAPDQLVEGQTYFVVGHAYKSSGLAGSNYDRYEIWVNPAFADFASPEAISTTGASGIANFTDIGVRTANIGTGDQVIFGALRLGATWADVVPTVPEPVTASLGLMALGALGVAMRRGRTA
jgi:PEP-CTERM motif